MVTQRAIIALLLAGLILSAARGEEIANKAAGPLAVVEFGAKGDGQTKDTAAIQKAIDAAAVRGGGMVRFPAGTYLSGSLHLKSGVTLHLDSGATIKGSKEIEDYDPCERLPFKNASDRETSFFHFALIWGEDVENAGIVGSGNIDSNRDKRGGPKPIALKRCRGITIRGITIRNAPNYNISMLGTDDVVIDGVTILNGYCDGIDPDACHNVSISNCHIESWDDAIVLKTSFSLGERRSTENVTVTNCLLATACNAFKLGTESGGDFKRIAVSNCAMFRRGDDRPAISGIAIESVDGANVDGVVISNITMVDVRAPIFVRLGNRGRDLPAPIPGTLKNVMIENVTATGASLCSSITGIPDHPVEGVSLSNIRLNYIDGDPGQKFCDEVPEKVEHYPDADMFDCVPAYGLFCRHVEGIKLTDVQLRYDSATRWNAVERKIGKDTWEKVSGGRTDLGRALVCDDVREVEISGLTAQAVCTAARPGEQSKTPVLEFRNVRGALIRGCSPPVGTDVFLRITGDKTAKIGAIGNDFRSAAKPVVIEEGARKEETGLESNLGH